MENLTEKEEKVIGLIQEGKSKIDSVLEVYNFKNRQSASVYSSRLFKKPKVRERLRTIQEKVDDKLADKNISFLDLLLKHISMEEIAEKLADNLKSNDKRVSDSALEKAMRVISAYPKEELQTLDGANFQIVMVGGKKENGIKTLEGKTKNLPMIMQGGENKEQENGGNKENNLEDSSGKKKENPKEAIEEGITQEVKE